MDDRTQLDPAFFSIPESKWLDVGADSYPDLRRLQLASTVAMAEIDRVIPDRDRSGDSIGATTVPVPAPADLALLMHEVAGSLFSRTAADEQDLRQIISTLRTALAVCWDLYSLPESERVTVAEHMRNLKARIEGFEGELLEVQRFKKKADDVPLH